MVDRSRRLSAAVISAAILEVRFRRQRDVGEHDAPAEVAPHRFVGARARHERRHPTSAANPTTHRRMSFTRLIPFTLLTFKLALTDAFVKAWRREVMS